MKDFMKNLKENDPRTFAVIGAAMEVHTLLGCGFLEPVYQAALTLEFTKREIPFSKEVKLPVFYKGVRLKTPYKVDFICFDNVVIIKSSGSFEWNGSSSGNKLPESQQQRDRVAFERWHALTRVQALYCFRFGIICVIGG